MARKKGYGQFCPVAKAAEIVAERWTPLVVRELLCGSRRFNDIRKGVPLMSPSLLAQRLRELEDAGVIERGPSGTGSGAEYRLTPAGEALRPVIENLGVWGQRWAQHTVEGGDLDPELLMWDVRRRVNVGALPAEQRTVIRFDIEGVPSKKSRWWLVVDRGEVDLCLKNPGYEVELQVSAHIRDLVDVWLGKAATKPAISAGALRLEGARPLVRSFPDWFALSSFADATPPRAARANVRA